MSKRMTVAQLSRRVDEIALTAAKADLALSQAIDGIVAREQVVRSGRDERILALEAECRAKAEAILELQDTLAKTREELRLSHLRLERVEPTWTSSKGKTYRIKDMPTRYLTNVYRFLRVRDLYCTESGSGLYKAIDNEIARRMRDR